LTNEQKTKICTTVIPACGAPKIELSQFNFSLSGGFVVADEIIVEPDTLKIAAVLTV